MNRFNHKIYKPNKSNSGHMLELNTTVNKTSGQAEIYLKLVKQKSWDEQKNIGTFKDGESLSVKLSTQELAGIAAVLDTVKMNTSDKSAEVAWTAYHNNPNDSQKNTQITFTSVSSTLKNYYNPTTRQKEEKTAYFNYVLSVVRGDKKFSITINKLNGEYYELLQVINRIIQEVVIFNSMLKPNSNNGGASYEAQVGNYENNSKADTSASFGSLEDEEMPF